MRFTFYKDLSGMISWNKFDWNTSSVVIYPYTSLARRPSECQYGLIPPFPVFISYLSNMVYIISFSKSRTLSHIRIYKSTSSGKSNETTNYSQLLCPTGKFSRMLLESNEKILYETEVNTNALKAVLIKRRLTVLKIYLQIPHEIWTGFLMS